jgi:hypothetical protein
MSDDLGRTTPLLGVRYYVTPFPARNAEAALIAWEDSAGATLYADGLGWYAVALHEQAVVHQGWTPISPQTLLADTLEKEISHE